MSLTEAIDQLKQRWDRFFETVTRPLSCLFCKGGRILWNGSRLRSVSVRIEGRVHHLAGIRCCRVKCKDCRKSWALRPPGLAPHRHYQLCVVASATSAYLFDPKATQAAIALEHQCSERTVGRWLRWISTAAEPTVLQLKVLEAAGEPILASDRDVANLARKARDAARREILPRAARVLAGFEALGVAMGMEPPGLRGILERFLGNRTGIATYQRPLIPEFAR